MTALCRLLLKQSTFFDQRKWDLNHPWPKKSNQILTKQFEKNKYLICRSRNLRPGHHHKIHFLGLFLKWHQYRISRSNFSRNSSVTIWARLKIVDFFSNPSKNPEKIAAFQTRRYLRSKHNTAPRTPHKHKQTMFCPLVVLKTTQFDFVLSTQKSTNFARFA